MNLTKKVVVHFDPDIYNKVKERAENNSISISGIINDILIDEFQCEDEDLEICWKRQSEPVISYEELIAQLKSKGKK